MLKIKSIYLALLCSLLFNGKILRAEGPAFVPIKFCAVLWAHPDFDPYKPPEGQVAIDAETWVNNLKSGSISHDRQTSAASVRRGCTLELYGDKHYQELLQIIDGPAITTSADGSFQYDNQVRAVHCTCL